MIEFFIKYKTISLVILISFLVIFSTVSAATNLNPVGIPEATMKTLEDIYQRILVGTSAVSHNIYPSTNPAGTMHTLDDVYNIIPNSNRVCTGTNGGTAVCAPTEWSGDLLGYDEDYYYATSLCMGNNESPWIGRTPDIGELSKAMGQYFFEGNGPTTFVEGDTYFSDVNLDDASSWWSATYNGGVMTILKESPGNGRVNCVK